MDDLLAIAESLVRKQSLPFYLALDDKSLVATLPHHSRSQRVVLSREGDDYVFTSLVAAKSRVPESGKARSELLLRLYRQNAATDLVSFGIDGRGRVVGQCRHPAESLDLEELEAYVVALVHDCDRLEWVLTGEDRY